MPPNILDPVGIGVSVIEAIIDAFVSIFEQAGSESIRRAVDTVLTAASPNLSSDWFLATYFVLFGFGCALAFTVSLLRAFQATLRSDAYRFITVWKHNILHYALGYWLPASYLFLHILFVKAGQAMADGFGINDQTADNLNLTTGSIGNRLLAGIVNWGLGGLLDLQTWFVITTLPTLVLLGGVFLLGLADIGGEKGEKVWSAFMALLLTSLFSILLYVFWLGIGHRITEGVEDAGTVANSMVWWSTIVLILALLCPVGAWFLTYLGVQRAVQNGTAVFNGQLRGTQQIRQMGGSQTGQAAATPAARRNRTRAHRAEARGRRVSDALKSTEDLKKGLPAGERFANAAARRANSSAKTAAARAAAGKSTVAATTTGGLAAVAAIAANRMNRRRIRSVQSDDD